MDYQVDLDTFRGPLDLLLFLVKRHEVDICDIQIAKLTDQFLEYLRVLDWIDFENAGEFLVMAASLMEIKSRTLLPRTDGEELNEDDPRKELVRQLLEYKKFKDAAGLLEAQAEKQTNRIGRLPVPGASDTEDTQRLRSVELWDLVSAFGRLVRETMALQPQQIIVDDTPIHVYQELLLNELRTRSRISFASAFNPPHTRGRLVGFFLAILELIKSKRIMAEQAEPFDDIWLTLPGGDTKPSDV